MLIFHQYFYIMLDMTVQLPAKPYVKAWMENRYGIDHAKFGRVIPLTKETWEGKYFFSLCEAEKRRWDKRVFAKFSDSVTVLVTYDYYTRYRVTPNPTLILEFNYFAEDLIKEVMRTYVGALVDHGVKQVDAIRKYQDKYGFTEEDFSFESIKKDVQRNSDIKKKPNALRMSA